MMKKNNYVKLLLILLMIFGSINSYAQISVSGTVTDTKGEPLPGVEIIIIGTQNGTVTDFDGKYAIKAQKGDKIKASFVGMSPVTKTVSGPTLDFVLKDDALGLDEVVVTAQSGIATKRQLGTVIHSVKAEDLAPRTVANVAEALQGALSGAQIMRNNGSAAPSISIRLRGASTILGNSSPLIMVDGMIINNDERQSLGIKGSSDPLSDIDMNDIDHIEVLKGPAASAMYGSMASNGIIQIFTKKGKTGEPTVTVTSNYNINQIRKYKPYNKALFRWDGTTKVPVEKRYDYQSYIFKKTSGVYNGIKVSGGNENTTYSIGGSYLNNDGILRNSSYKRNNLDLKLGQRINKFLKLDLGVIYSNNKTEEVPYNTSWLYSPTIATLFVDNYINPINPDGTYTSFGWKGNPYETTDLVRSFNDVNHIISNFKISFKPIDKLNIDYIFGYDFTNQKGKFYAPYGLTSDTDGDLKFSNSNLDILSSHIKANYRFNITDNIKSSTGAGYQYLYNRDRGDYSSKPKLSIFPNLQVLDGADDINSISHVYEYAIWGTWVQQHFNLFDKLFLTLGGRWDKASTFGDDVQAFYPKASGAIVLSDFDFWKNNIGKYINSFKIRGAWGEAGNMSVLTNSKYLYIKDGSSYYSGSYLGETTYEPSPINGNKNIKPEVTRETEFGFDAGLLNGRLGIEFSIYHQDVKDLVLERLMALSSGFKSGVDNIGTLTNDGIEVSINAVPIKKKNFNWNFSINYSANKNKVNDIQGGWLRFGGFGYSIAANGYPLGMLYGTFYATDDKGDFILNSDGNPQTALGIMIDKDGDGFAESYKQQFDSNGQPTGEPLYKILGDPNPDFILSFNNSFKYKNLTFGFTLEAVQGFDAMNWDKRIALKYGGWEFTQIELENNKPGWYSSRYGIFESFVEDASFVKLRNVYLSYNWKTPVKGIKNIKLTLSGSNLISWDKYWGYDPEVNSWGAENVTRAQDMGNIPIPKVYTFGIQFKF